ncbi:MAG: acetyl-CoA hydrolase, partial [Syntrophomonadaceae bacterium]|nr:acetyl-CoA hydrolase [Syntrophomonadaceae bacterium]
MDWQGEYQKRLASIEEMAQKVQSGDVIGIGLGLGGCSSDIHEAILDRNAELENVFIIDAVQVRRSKLYDPKFMASIDGRINYISGFGTAPVRNINREKVAGFLPIMTIDAYEKLAERSDIFIAQVTPPNKNGFVNLGLSNFYTMDAIRLGKKKGKLRLAVAEVND